MWSLGLRSKAMAAPVSFAPFRGLVLDADVPALTCWARICRPFGAGSKGASDDYCNDAVVMEANRNAVDLGEKRPGVARLELVPLGPQDMILMSLSLPAF